jgi:3'-phosphoadenosine 5'-phosphosulfate sulfotransferase (PAPS reductase)/FAD synthetase
VIPKVCLQPLAYWEFEDCFTYAQREGFGLHPMHEKGYPSLGDVHSTLPVDRSRWFEYGGERSGRFQGLTNADGSLKTECGANTIAFRRFADGASVPSTAESGGTREVLDTGHAQYIGNKDL